MTQPVHRDSRLDVSVTTVTAWACAMSAVLALVAGMIGGAPAMIAVAGGWGVAALCTLALASGLLGALAATTAGARGPGGLGVGLAFLVRHAFAAAILWVLVPRVPAAWLLVGVTTWPVAFLIEGARHVAGRADVTARAES
jgi:hypothetical protein